MASEGSRRLEVALKMMAEAIQLKLAEMDPSPGTGTSGGDSADLARPEAVAEMTLRQREHNFKKNMYPRWKRDVGDNDLRVISSVAELIGRPDVSVDVYRLLANEIEQRAYEALGGGTALHWAVRMEDPAAVARILAGSQGNYVNDQDAWWKATALHWAARIGNIVIVQAMLTAPSSSQRFSLAVKDKWNRTALECAILKSNVPMVRELLRIWNPVDVNEGDVTKDVNDGMCREASIEKIQHFFDSQRETWFAKMYPRKGTILHWAVIMEDMVLASQIVAQGTVNVNAKNCSGYSSLHLAILLGDLGMVKIMVARHLELGNFDMNFVEDGTRYTALHCAIVYERKENTDMVRELLKCKETMRLTEECYSGETPLQIAHERGFKDIQKALLEHQGVQRFVDELFTDRQVYMDAANAILVGAALIASVTFASWLNPPLGYASGSVNVQSNRGLGAFWIFNCLSFYFAIGTVVFWAQSVLPRNPCFIKVTVEKLRRSLLVTAFLLACTVFFVIIAFGIAGSVVLPPKFKAQAYNVIPTIVGGLVCVISLGSFFIGKLDRPFVKNTTLVKGEKWKRIASRHRRVSELYY